MTPAFRTARGDIRRRVPAAGIPAVEQLTRRHWALLMAAIAGFGMMMWIFVELAIILQHSVLQTLYFGLGGLELILVVVLLGIAPGIVAPRRGASDIARRSKKWDSPRTITASNGSRTATPNAPDRLAPGSRVPFGVENIQ